MTATAVGGRNSRVDFRGFPAEEFFYQLENRFAA
jgi:hypothetical protein